MVHINVQCGDISFRFELEGKSRQELLEVPMSEAFAMARSKTQHRNLRLASKPQCLRDDDFNPNHSGRKKDTAIDCIALSRIGEEEEALGIYIVDTALPLYHETHDLRLLPYFPHGLDIDCLPEIMFISFGGNSCRTTTTRTCPVVYVVPPEDGMRPNQMIAFGYPMLSSSSPTVNDLFQVACTTEGVDGEHCLSLVSSEPDSVTKTFSMSANCSSIYGNYRLHDLGLSGPTIRAFLSPLSITVNVKTLTGQNIPFHCSSSDTVESLKLQIEQKKGIPFAEQRLIHAGRPLVEGQQPLSFYNIYDGATIHLLLRLGMFHPTSARSDMEKLGDPELQKVSIYFDSGFKADISVNVDCIYKGIKDWTGEFLSGPSGSTEPESKQRRVERLRAELKAAEDDLSGTQERHRSETLEDYMIVLLKEEATMRKSDEIQALIEKAENSAESDWMDVVSNLQRRIVETHNMSNSCQLTVRDLRRAALRYPDIAFWVKYNRARQGHLQVGDASPIVPLFRASDTQEVTNVWSNAIGKTTVVFAGSIS